MSTKLIKELKKEHKQILSLFNGLTDYLAGKIVHRLDVMINLRKLKATLIKHLEKEDKFLYPALKKAKDKKTRETAKKFSDRMLKISKTVLAFFDKYLHLKMYELGTNEAARKDLREIVTSVAKRVDVEEKVLFPLYAHCSGKIVLKKRA